MSQETLLGHSTIWLFGRELTDVRILNGPYGSIPETDKEAEQEDTPNQGEATHNFFLVRQLKAKGARLARIYAFSYQGEFFELASPPLFVVHGRGLDPEGSSFEGDPLFAKLSQMPANIGRTGVASLAGAFAEGIKVWAYDRTDFTVRFDMDSGSFDSLLLSAELGTEIPRQSAGSVARAAGSVARSAGSVARAAGSVARARRRSDSGTD